MSRQAALAFREYARRCPHVEAEIRSALLKDDAVDNTDDECFSAEDAQRSTDGGVNNAIGQ